MGWDFCDAWTTKAAAKKAYVEGLGADVKVLAEAPGRYGYWFAMEAGGNRFVVCLLVEKERGAFGFKDMHEMEGPFYYDCPAKVFDFVKDRPVDEYGTSSRGWRYEVRKRLGMTGPVAMRLGLAKGGA